jgi:hypothetical protein
LWPAAASSPFGVELPASCGSVSRPGDKRRAEDRLRPALFQRNGCAALRARKQLRNRVEKNDLAASERKVEKRYKTSLGQPCRVRVDTREAAAARKSFELQFLLRAGRWGHGQPLA